MISNDLVLEQIMDIKEDIGSIKSTQKSFQSQLSVINTKISNTQISNDTTIRIDKKTMIAFAAVIGTLMVNVGISI